MAAEQPVAPPAVLLGVDFTSAPSRRKPITLARGTLDGRRLRLQTVEALSDFEAFEAALAAPGPWLGAFDFPFGLPRVFVDELGLGATAAEVGAALHARCLDRMALRALIDAWANGRPSGDKLPHRRTDLVLGGTRSTSPLQTRYVPVGFMWFEGLRRLLAAGLHLPGLHPGDPTRVAVEGYPGALAHALIGRRSYKNGPDADRLHARVDLVDALEGGRAPGAVPRLQLSQAERAALVADDAGDRLDAVLCLLQAAWAASQPGHGVPAGVDPVEGWIVTPVGGAGDAGGPPAPAAHRVRAVSTGSRR